MTHQRCFQTDTLLFINATLKLIQFIYQKVNVNTLTKEGSLNAGRSLRVREMVRHVATIDAVQKTTAYG